MTDEFVTLTVENNKGITDDVEKKGYKGIGLANVRKRLEMTYPGNHQVKITDQLIPVEPTTKTTY